jgi:hypothetical protein
MFAYTPINHREEQKNMELPGSNYLRQRSQAKSMPMSFGAYILLIISIGIILGLFINTIGIIIEPNAGLYVLGVTRLLVESMFIFIMSLGRFLHPLERD